MHYDVHHDAIFHCTKVIDVDKHNVRAARTCRGSNCATDRRHACWLRARARGALSRPPLVQPLLTPRVATPRQVKALYRRACAHLLIPQERHINGLALAFQDLHHALEHDPQNAEVKKELKRATQLQKKTDAKAAGMFSKMVAGAIEV